MIFARDSLFHPFVVFSHHIWRSVSVTTQSIFLCDAFVLTSLRVIPYLCVIHSFNPNPIYMSCSFRPVLLLFWHSCRDRDRLQSGQTNSATKVLRRVYQTTLSPRPTTMASTCWHEWGGGQRQHSGQQAYTLGIGNTIVIWLWVFDCSIVIWQIASSTVTYFWLCFIWAAVICLSDRRQLIQASCVYGCLCCLCWTFSVFCSLFPCLT